MILHIRAVEAKDIPKMDVVGKADPYLTFQLTGSPDKYRTKDVKQEFEPAWNEEFHIPISQIDGTVLHVELFDWDRVSSDDLISTRDFDLKALEFGKVYDDWFEFFPAPKVPKPGLVHLVIQIANTDDYPFIQMTKELPKREIVIPEIGLDQEPLGISPRSLDKGINTSSEETVTVTAETATETDENTNEVKQETKFEEGDVKNQEETVKQIIEDQPKLLNMGQREDDVMPPAQDVRERDVEVQNQLIVEEKKATDVAITDPRACSEAESSNFNMKYLMIIVAIIFVELFILSMKRS